MEPDNGLKTVDFEVRPSTAAVVLGVAFGVLIPLVLHMYLRGMMVRLFMQIHGGMMSPLVLLPFYAGLMISGAGVLLLPVVAVIRGAEAPGTLVRLTCEGIVLMRRGAVTFECPYSDVAAVFVIGVGPALVFSSERPTESALLLPTVCVRVRGRTRVLPQGVRDPRALVAELVERCDLESTHLPALAALWQAYRVVDEHEADDAA